VLVAPAPLELFGFVPLLVPVVSGAPLLDGDEDERDFFGDMVLLVAVESLELPISFCLLLGVF
jgi:hypothetical protein